MKSVFLIVLKFFHGILFRVVQFNKLIFNSKYYVSPSYFSEYGTRKCVFRIFIEQCWNIIYHGDVNEFYFLYGFDIKRFRCFRDYVDNREFIRLRNGLNKENLMRPICVLRNKFLFGIVAESLGVNSPHNIGLIAGKKVFLLDEKRTVDLKTFLCSKEVIDVFIKTVNGECGNGVFSLQKEAGNLYLDKKAVTIEEVCDYLDLNMTYIIQNRIKQHTALNRLYSHSINTIRVETVVNPQTNQIEILPPLLRVGSAGNNVDNWAMGGLAIGINNDGTLKEYGFYKPSFGTKTNLHPDTKIVFNGYQLPFFDEAIEMAIRFHRYLYDVHSIGWDIALTESGPCFIEGNDNWEISLVQVCSKGLRKEFKKLFFN